MCLRYGTWSVGQEKYQREEHLQSSNDTKTKEYFLKTIEKKRKQMPENIL